MYLRTLSLLLLSFCLGQNVMAQVQELNELVTKVDPVASELWDVSLGRMAIQDLPESILNLHWQQKLATAQTGKTRELSFNFGLDQANEFVIENISVGVHAQAPINYGHRAIRDWKGQFHSHPYKYESLRDNSYSSTDVCEAIQKAKKTGEGFVWLLASDEYYFALVIEDVKKTEEHWERLTKKGTEAGFKYPRDYANQLYRRAPITEASSYEISVNGSLAILGKAEENGIGFYVTRKSDINFQKLN